jgi:hypothetical protein
MNGVTLSNEIVLISKIYKRLQTIHNKPNIFKIRFGNQEYLLKI